ncbi:hypothetical protein N9O21_00090 [Rhodobacteraceae bacterium]|nr:hypothetical protein [Paracoccaceae bacterium]
MTIGREVEETEDNSTKNPADALKKSYRANKSLYQIALISIFAFFGFGAVFTQLDVSLGGQAVTAAFGALFVILSTKFLMETESENQTKGDKRSEIFKENVKDYKETAQQIIKILADEKLSSQEISQLLQNHAFLTLIGTKDSLDASRAFIKTCQGIMKKAQEDGEQDFKVEIESSDLETLWGQALTFMKAAREGLELGGAVMDVEKENELFQEVVKEQINTRVRSEVPIETFFKNKKITTNEDQISVSKLIKNIEISKKLQSRITETSISFASEGVGNVLYLKRVRTTDNRMTASLRAQKKGEDFCRKAEELLSGKFQGKFKEGRDGFSLSFAIPLDDVDNIQPLIDLTDNYISKFHKASDDNAINE